MKNHREFSKADKGEFIHMTLSDHVSVNLIAQTYGLNKDEVKKYMKLFVSPGSYRALRERVKAFTQRRQCHK
jgi:uncharacterized protein (TIGR03643 family)